MSGNNEVKSLRTLIKVRQRQGKRLEEALNEAKRQLAQRESELQAAVEEHGQGMTDEQTARDERGQLMNGAFTPDAIRSLDFRIEDCKANVTKLEKNIEERRKAMERHVPMVTAAQAAVRRNEQRIEGFEERIKKVLAERELAAEERAEEETEEASTARFVARIRASKEAQF